MNHERGRSALIRINRSSHAHFGVSETLLFDEQKLSSHWQLRAQNRKVSNEARWTANLWTLMVNILVRKSRMEQKKSERQAINLSIVTNQLL